MDVAAGSRVVFSYSVTVDGVRRWTSLVTVSLSALALPSGDGTRLRHTEQYAYLAYDGDGTQDIAHLKGSLPLQLNGLAAALSATGRALASPSSSHSASATQEAAVGSAAANSMESLRITVIPRAWDTRNIPDKQNFPINRGSQALWAASLPVPVVHVPQDWRSPVGQR
jgi:hypothetical protein